jgi:DNA-binding transcriptional LysR family regulator
MLDLLELAIFVRAVEGRSLSSAASALSIPRSTVTRRLAQLEDRLGVQLLHRSTRSMSLTEAGEAFYPRASRLVSDAEAAFVEITESQSEPKGRLRVTAPVEFGDSFLFAMSVEFMNTYPDVALEMDLTNRQVDLIAEGYDLAIRAGRLADSSLIARKLLGVNFGVYASRDYLDAFGEPTAPAELTRHRIVHLGRGAGPFEWNLRRGRDEVTVPVQPALVVNHVPALREAVAGGVGVGLIPKFYLKSEACPAGMVNILPEWSADGGGLYAVTPSNRHPRAVVQRFIELVQRVLQAGESA